MTWTTLGTVTINDWEWKTFPLPVIDGLLFRVTHSYNLPIIGRAVICSVFADGSRGVFRRTYPSSEASLIQMPVPRDFVSAGYSVRYLSVKPNLHTRWYATSNWTIQIEEYNFPEGYQAGESLDDLLAGQDLTLDTLERIEQRITRLNR